MSLRNFFKRKSAAQLFEKSGKCGHALDHDTFSDLVDRGLRHDDKRFGERALTVAAQWGYLGIIDKLISQSPGAEGMKDAFEAALWYAHPRIVARFLELGMDVNQRFFYARTPLIVASLIHQKHERKIEIVEMLIAAGARLDARETYKGDYTALMIASEDGDGQLRDILIKAGADQSLKDRFGRTADDLWAPWPEFFAKQKAAYIEAMGKKIATEENIAPLPRIKLPRGKKP